MTVADSIALAEELERYLGDPHDPNSRMPFTKVLYHDEREEFPFELVGVLQRWGLHEYCLPESYGGRPGDVELGFNLLRLAARRDPGLSAGLDRRHRAAAVGHAPGDQERGPDGVGPFRAAPRQRRAGQ